MAEVSGSSHNWSGFLNMDEVGRPLCPCNFYPEGKKAQVEKCREWNCACDEMKKYEVVSLSPPFRDY